MTPTAPKPGDIPAQLDDLPDGTVVTGANGAAYQLCSGRWWGFHAPTGRPSLPVCDAPYTVRYVPEDNQVPVAIELDERLAEEITVSGNSIFVDGHRFPWFVQENPRVVPLDNEMVALQILLPTERVTVLSDTEAS